WIVTQGLEGGERIVVENAAQLAAGQKIKAVERPAPRAAPPETAAPARQPLPASGQQG
ncbi:efflux transporter periplasmic adaptor subunit, partial [Achromobacter denitrificans]|nr:efflux transporter periplasmic adaptor subunit [Achromobacter denitrificans]MDF3938815.1 efflux transporter periplasmic adaptor subunit [Achromobacter denitrificans]